MLLNGAMSSFAYLVRSASLLATAFVIFSCGGNTAHDGGGFTGGGNAGSSGSSGSGGSTGGSGAAGGGYAGSGGGYAGTGGIDIRACNQPTDCTIVDTRCCSCDTSNLSTLVPVNVAYTSQVAPRCVADCVACPAPPPNADVGQYFAATCTSGQCSIVDIRQTSLTQCSTDAECSLRAGSGCCEGCGSSGWIALSDPTGLGKLVCGTEPVGCPACFPMPDPYLSAACIGSRCVTQYGACTVQHPCPL
jgi:hypothetical protein